MQSGDVVPLFEGNRENRSQTTNVGVAQNALSRAWKRVTSFAVAVAEVARETRELEKRLLNRPGYRRFTDS